MKTNPQKETPMQPGITLDGRDMLVLPPKYPSHEVKEVLGGRWDKEAKAWRLPPISLNVLKLCEWYGEEFIRTAPDVIQDLAFQEWETSDPERETRPTGFEGWSEEELEEAAQHPAWNTLYGFQKEAVEYLCTNPHGCSLLGLAPGLGKTPTSTVAADILGLEKILILAPVTLTHNWKREIDKWGKSGRDVHRATADDRTVGPEVTVANHEVIQDVVLRDENGVVMQPDWRRDNKRVKEWREAGPKKPDQKNPNKQVWARERIVQLAEAYDQDWDAVIVDESILLKNRKAVKANVLSTVAKRSEWVWMLSGSPTSKYRDDLFKQLQIMFPRGFTSYWRFAEQFCVVERGQWGWSIEGDRPDMDPQHYLRDFLFIHTDDSELPDYVYRPIEVELKPQQRKAFDSMLNDWVAELESADPSDPAAVEADGHLAQMTRLQQITSNMKTLEAATGKRHAAHSTKEDLLVELIQQGEIEMPLLVWAWWVPTTHSIADRLKKDCKDLSVVSVTGEDKREEKEERIEAYKAGDVDVLVMQMGVGKYGHTLTDTRTVFYHDRTFDGDAYFQSLRRVRRIGLKHKPHLIIPKAHNSADEMIDENLAGKVQSIAKMTNADLLALLRSLGSKRFVDDQAIYEALKETQSVQAA